MSVEIDGTLGITSPGGDSSAVDVTTPKIKNAGTLALEATGANVITATTNGSEAARIDSNGSLLVGRTTGAYGNKVVSQGGFASLDSNQFNITAPSSGTDFEWVLRTGLTMRFFVNDASVVANLSAAGVWTDASDARYKENIRPISYGLAEVMQLQPRTYNMIDSNLEQIGFVAQEVETILPELVGSTHNSVTNEDRLTLSYSQMSAVLVKAIQEQQAIITSLTARIEQLENQ